MNERYRVVRVPMEGSGFYYTVERQVRFCGLKWWRELDWTREWTEAESRELLRHGLSKSKVISEFDTP